MKRIIILLAVNVLLLGLIVNLTNESAILNDDDLQIGKTYIAKDNKNNKIVLYGDYTAEYIKCSIDDCQNTQGHFTIKDDYLKIYLYNDDVISFRVKNSTSFCDDEDVYILE